MALGEAYMANMIDIDGDLQKIIECIYNNDKNFLKVINTINIIKNNINESKDNVQCHYDIGNEFYSLWLDDSMTYSCGYFITDEDSLNKAQKIKLITY